MSQLHTELVDALLALARVEDKDQSLIRDYFTDIITQSEATTLAHTILSSVVSFLESHSSLSDLQRRVIKQLLEELDKSRGTPTPTNKGVPNKDSRQESTSNNARELVKTYPFGHKVMSAYGWVPEQGLGLGEGGIKEPLGRFGSHGFKPDNKLGLGHSQAQQPQPEKHGTSEPREDSGGPKKGYPFQIAMRPGIKTCPYEELSLLKSIPQSEEAQKYASRTKTDMATYHEPYITDYVLRNQSTPRARHSPPQQEENIGEDKNLDFYPSGWHSPKKPATKTKPSSGFYKPSGLTRQKLPNLSDAVNQGWLQEQEQQANQPAQPFGLHRDAIEYMPDLDDSCDYTPLETENDDEKPKHHSSGW